MFAEPSKCHHDANVYQHLCRVLHDINQRDEISFIVFTGDLTQDHSEESYQLFIGAFSAIIKGKPLYYIAGNHDEPLLLTRYFQGEQIYQDKTIELNAWQVHLIDTKSETPAGKWHEREENRLANVINSDKAQCLLMHHHVKDVGYFIDKHHVVNQHDFVQFTDNYKNICIVACGHVHNALTMTLGDIPFYTCPATSIQFDKTVATVANSKLPPGYRLFTLNPDKTFMTEAIFLAE